MTLSTHTTYILSQTQRIAAYLLVATFTLTGCQSESSSASVSEVETQYVDSIDQTSVEALGTDGRSMSRAEVNAIAPTFVEGVSDALAHATDAPDSSCQNDHVVAAFKVQQSDIQVKGCGTIVKLLPDDNEGSRHQRILIELTGVEPQHTLLLVHNIDLAPPVSGIDRGSPVSFYGEYVYNDKGGLVHWTHHDPAARHQGGWIDSNGVRYE